MCGAIVLSLPPDCGVDHLLIKSAIPCVFLNSMYELGKDFASIHQVRFETYGNIMDGGVIVEDSDPAQFFTSPKTDRARRFLSTFEYESVN